MSHVHCAAFRSSAEQREEEERQLRANRSRREADRILERNAGVRTAAEQQGQNSAQTTN
jgi:hypothetical protein